MAAAEAAHELQLMLDDGYGIADSSCLLGFYSLCIGDWQRSERLFAPAARFAAERIIGLIAHWVEKGMVIAACMRQQERASDEEPTYRFRFSPFKARLLQTLYSDGVDYNFGNSVYRRTDKTSYRRVFRKLLRLATIDRDRAICLLLTADRANDQGESARGINLLALAECYQAISKSRMGRHPLIVSLQQSDNRYRRAIVTENGCMERIWIFTRR